MSVEQNTDIARRRFLSGVATMAGLTVAPGVLLVEVAQAKPKDQPVTSAVRWGMLIDTNKCGDCTACVTACQEENGWGPTSASPETKSSPRQQAQWIRKVTLKHKSTGATHNLPMMCQHCEVPPCADVCPTGASFRRADGIVLVNKHTCIGCRYCMMACPYKARSFIHEDLRNQKPYSPRGKGTVESCTLCVHRVDSNQIPACAEACNAKGHNAMVFGDLNDPNSKLSKVLARHDSRQIRADLGLNPGIHYKGI
jgi:molybdopterin-containing oxidoreductase family iron-sulfur binding subunit